MYFVKPSIINILHALTFVLVPSNSCKNIQLFLIKLFIEFTGRFVVTKWRYVWNIVCTQQRSSGLHDETSIENLLREPRKNIRINRVYNTISIFLFLNIYFAMYISTHSGDGAPLCLLNRSGMYITEQYVLNFKSNNIILKSCYFVKP